MSGIKTCPLCGTQRWDSDGKVVLEAHDLGEFKLFGLSLVQIEKAIQWAKAYGWSEQKK